MVSALNACGAPFISLEAQNIQETQSSEELTSVEDDNPNESPSDLNSKRGVLDQGIALQSETPKENGSGDTVEDMPTTSREPDQDQPIDPANYGIEIIQDLRPSLSHGPKGAEYQKYIVIHDTEGLGDPKNVVDWWDSNGNLVASQFVIGQDGTIIQVVPLDEIAHHAGFGDAGHNELYGVADESRDDKLGTTAIGDWAPDYGMNSYSLGIELVHLGSTGEDYPPEQLEALDGLIAYIDDFFGTESQIIDHKAWRSGNSDTSAEFEPYLVNYQTTRTHDGS